MCFFGKKKKWENLNAQSKREFLSILERYVQRTNDNNVAAKLESAKGVLNEQGSSSSKEVVKLDIKIRQYLADLGKDIAAGSSGVVLSKLDTIIAKLRERAPYCMDNTSRMTKEDLKKQEEAEKLRARLAKKDASLSQEELYTPEQLIGFMLQEASDRLSALEKRRDEVFDILNARPKDSLALSEWNELKIKIKTAQQRVQMLSDERYRATLTQSMQSLTAEQKKLIAMRQVSDEQFDLLTRDYNKMLERQGEDKARTKQAAEDFLNGGNAVHGTAQDPVQGTVSSAMDDPDFIEMQRERGGQAAAAPARAAHSSSASAMDDPDFLRMRQEKMGASAPDPGSSSLEETLECIDDIVLSLRKCEVLYGKKLEHSKYELQDLDMQLKQLLEKRRKATASDCLVLDGEIDRLYAERQNVKNAISRYRQEQAINTEKLTLATQLKTQRDLNAIRSRVRDIIGDRFANLEDYAMALRDSVQKGNEELERIGTVNAVANGVDIRTGTMTGREAQASAEFETKDEDKYAALERELGIGRN